MVAIKQMKKKNISKREIFKKNEWKKKEGKVTKVLQEIQKVEIGIRRVLWLT